MLSMAASSVSSFSFLVFLLVYFSKEVTFAQNPTSVIDSHALRSLRGSLGIRKVHWPLDSDCCQWTGVKCTGGRVTGLNLTGLLRTNKGRANASFAVDGLQNLSLLTYFNSTGFALPGAIPEWFGTKLPTSVTVLDLRRSSISGALPETLGSLTSLDTLVLSGNRLTGTIPSSLGSLGNLTLLDLSSNSLRGSIPPRLGNLTNLTSLVLSNNTFTGSVPGILGDLSELTTLDLRHNTLSGWLPADLKNLKNIQVFNLGNNNLSGKFTEDIFLNFPRLWHVNLNNNNFSGELPSSFWTLPGLQFVDVSYNLFNGALPVSFVNLNINGAVVNISHNLYHDYLPSGAEKLVDVLSFLDISYNYFEGSTPFGNISDVSDIGNCFTNGIDQRSQSDCMKFYTNNGFQFDGSLPPYISNPGTPSASSGGRNKRYLIYLLVGIFGGLFVVALVAFLFLLFRRRHGAVSDENDTDVVVPRGITAHPHVTNSPSFQSSTDSFTYDYLSKVTCNFSLNNLIKNGHSGSLYHGKLDGGAPVVVKKIDTNAVARELYVVEMEFLSRASHTRFVPYLGHCMEKENEKFFVYKYMPNADLATAFYRKSGKDEENVKSLDWITRQKIAIGVAEALVYMHHECVPPIVHRSKHIEMRYHWIRDVLEQKELYLEKVNTEDNRADMLTKGLPQMKLAVCRDITGDIKATSVLLDDKFEVRLGSLSQACIQEGDGQQSAISRLLRPSQSSSSSSSGSAPAACAYYDVYCFGKVLLELVTGNLGISTADDATAREMVNQIVPNIDISEKDLLNNILDPTLIVDEDLMEEVLAMAIVAKSCLNPKTSRRPPMNAILKALQCPLKVIRDQGASGSALLRSLSSRALNMTFFGSWRSSREITVVAGPSKDPNAIKNSRSTSQESGGDRSFNQKRSSSEIFPEPATVIIEVQ